MLDKPAPTPAELAEQYYRDGYVFPVDVFSKPEALKYRTELEALEKRLGDSTVGNKEQLNYPHVIFKFAAEIVRSPKLLDVVEAMIGPNILVWGATFFIKEPHTESFVSWHQDLRYWGLNDNDGQVSAWVALSPVNIANGCMRFIPGSHKGEMRDHNDTFGDDNILTRGQEVAVDEEAEELVHVELEPGQASFHHGKLLHASAPNHSDERRIGLAINYVSTHVKQSVAPEDFGTLVRGEDTHHNFQLVPPPEADLSEEAMAWHARILKTQNEAFYEGV